jgi:hypothetical protein
MKVYSIEKLLTSFSSVGEIICICASEELAQQIKKELENKDETYYNSLNEKNYVRYFINDHLYFT